MFFPYSRQPSRPIDKMSTSVEGGPLNGHLSPEPEYDQNSHSEAAQSDSDLSDVQREPADEPSPSPSDSVLENSKYVDGEMDMSASDDEPTPDNAFEDAEFDMEESPPSQHDDAVETRSSSSGSHRASKRKVSPAEDQYMRDNPELYGLRRSVSIHNLDALRDIID